MAAQFDIPQVFGIQEALKEINDFDKKFRREITKQIQGAGEQIVNEARSMVTGFANSKGNGNPLSGMARGNLVKGRETSWRTDQVQKGFKVKVGQRASKERYVNYSRQTDGVVTHTEQVVFGAKPYNLMVIQQANAAGAIYDHAGRNTSGLFVANLNKEVGQQPRAIDVAVERNRPAVTAAVLEIVDTVMKAVNKNLQVRHGN